MRVYKKNGINLNITFKLAVIFAVVDMFSACGDDVTKNNITQSAVDVVESLDEVTCDQESAGKTIFLEMESTLYVCNDEKWMLLNGNESSDISGKSASSNAKSNASSDTNNEKSSGSTSDKSDFQGNGCSLENLSDGYYKVVCGDNSITVKNVDSLFKEIEKSKEDNSIEFDNPVYVGENSAVKITLKLESATASTVEVDFCASECSPLTLSRKGGVYVGELTLNSKKNDVANKLYKIAENGIATVQYKTNDKTLEAKATWVLKSKGYVQFNSDSYSIYYPPTNASIYLYDYDNINDTAYVTVSSSKNRSGMKIPLKRNNNIFSGSVTLCSWEKNNAIYVEDKSYIAVSYYDESLGETQVDSAYVTITMYKNASISANTYWGYDDKAVISVTDYQMGNPANVYSTRIWSDSDKEGTLLKYYVVSSIGMTGFIEFVKQKTDDDGKLYVTDGDKIYVGFDYGTGSGIKAADSAIWRESRKIVYGTLVDDRDDKTYQTVKIGKQVWMAENLNYSDSATYAGMKARSWCYDNTDDNCAKYGRLYTWAATVDSAGKWTTNGKGCGYGKTCTLTNPVRGICPEGWHLPTKNEWNALLEYIKTAYGSNMYTALMGAGATDAQIFSGFSALLAGYGNKNSFSGESSYAYFWSADEDGSGDAHYLWLYNTNAYLRDDYKYYANSVRCLQD